MTIDGSRATTPTRDSPGRMTSEVAAWTDAQRRYTREVLDAMPGRAVIEARLSVLFDTGEVTIPTVRSNRYFYSSRNIGEPQVTIVSRDGYLGADRVLIRTSDLDPSGVTRITWMSPSPDGKLLAYGVYRAGDAEGCSQADGRRDPRTLPLQIGGQSSAAALAAGWVGLSVPAPPRPARPACRTAFGFTRSALTLRPILSCTARRRPKRVRSCRRPGGRSARFLETASGSSLATGSRRLGTISGWPAWKSS